MAPCVLMLVVITVYPFVSNLFNSLRDYHLMRPYATRFVWFQNYLDIFRNRDFWHSLGLSLYFVLIVVLVETILGFIIATFLAEDFRGRKIFRTIIMLPYFLTPVAFAFGWRMMYHPTIGVINYMLGKLGLPLVNWLADPSTAMFSMILVDVWQCTPFMMLILLAGITSLPIEPIEAAKVDGASAWQILWRVNLPALRPIFIVAVLFRLLDAFKTFDIFMTMTGGGPGDATEVLNLHAYLYTFRFLNIGYASTVATIMQIGRAHV